ncbi:MAG: thiamine pyrophosphate-dependent enzyme [Eubacteriales bacterium]|nr:thiamine pyrophosphate-dependent enzyme [Eubacteriales bacterium]MDD4540953.1 thiamine pyrophosphate-dependent enzyme [Eubacteriales bacterium]
MSQEKNTERYTFETYKTAWCPGCGDFAILSSLKGAVEELELDPHKVVFAGGIGQAAKTPQYISGNRFCGLHGRALPAAAAIKLANDDLTVIINTGDGDGYGEGGNHFIAAIRRNVNITHFAHDNQVYGLTLGQSSPTSLRGYVTGSQPYGSYNEPLNPVATALVMGAGFVARGFAGDLDQLKELMKAAIAYEGYALVDIFQPCVSFNKVNTFAWYKEHVRPLGEEHDPTDFEQALKAALTFEGADGAGIPTGILYNVERGDYKSQSEVLQRGPLLKQGADYDFIEKEIQKLA